MNYNNKYINDYNEETYLKFLSDYSLLNALLNNYNSRYNQGGKVNGNFILLQESLNHYVIKQIKTSPSFVSTDAFKNYKKYLQNSFKFNTNFFFHNVFFNAFTKDELIQLLGNEFYNQVYQVASKKIDAVKNINNKISNGQQLTQDELNFICDAYAFNRDPNNMFHKNLIEYIFKNLTKLDSNLICTKYVLDTILSYVPKYYPQSDGFDAINSRIIADDENVKGVAISHGQSHIFLNRNIFENINFKSIEDSKKTYVKKGSDFTFLMIVANHELAHQYQNFMSKNQTFSNEGYMMVKRHILDKELHDYSENHDNDDIEIDATEKGWDICQKFYKEYMPAGQLQNNLLNQCKRNIQGTSNRRFEYMKKDLNTGIASYTPFYDVSNLNNIIYRNPKYVEQIPMLQTFYHKDGSVSLDFLKIENICMQSVGGDYITFMCLNFPRKVLTYLNHLNEKELNVALANITSGFRRYLKPIMYFDYNERNGLSSEHLKFDDNQSKTSLLKHYQKALELYKNIKFIFSDSVLMSKQSFLSGNLDVIESSMRTSKEKYGEIDAFNSGNLKR